MGRHTRRTRVPYVALSQHADFISNELHVYSIAPVNDDKHAGLAFKCSDLDASEHFISSVLAAHVRTMLVSSVSMTPPPVEQYCRNW